MRPVGSELVNPNLQRSEHIDKKLFRSFSHHVNARRLMQCCYFFRRKAQCCMMWTYVYYARLLIRLRFFCTNSPPEGKINTFTRTTPDDSLSFGFLENPDRPLMTMRGMH